MKNIFLTFDLEEFCLSDAPEEEKFLISKRGHEKVLEVLEKTDTKATFFTTCSFATKHPEVINNLIEKNHEIALHGMNHSHRYNKMPGDRALHLIKKAKEIMEDQFNIKIWGFRAPEMSHPKYSILKEAGLIYDSSLHPTWIPGYYNNFTKPRKIHKKEGMLVIPVSVTPIVRFPISWIWFRNLGLNYVKLSTKLSTINTNFINIYFHPWDFIDLSKENITKSPKKLIIRNSGDKALQMLENYINWTKKNNIKIVTIKDYLKDDSRKIL